MGLLVWLLGANWECARCGKQYRNAPRECRNCGHTVFDRVE